MLHKNLLKKKIKKLFNKRVLLKFQKLVIILFQYEIDKMQKEY